jgi:hypothetical protein
MAVSIDTVYQRVLAFANKEQRGYITPQEFNLFANQAQQEIFEQYFYDLNQFMRVPGNNTVYADVDDILEEKMQFFEAEDDATTIATYATTTNTPLPDYIHRVIRVEFDNNKCEILNANDFQQVKQAGLLLASSDKRPVANVKGNTITVIGDNSNTVIPTSIFYFKKPVNVNWGYVVVNDKALYNDNISVDFELHPSEESELVYRILAYAGIAIKQSDLLQSAVSLEATKVQQEKA